MSALRRVILMIVTFIVSIMLGAGLAQANTTAYYWQGTGPTVHAAASGVGHTDKSVNMSTDRGWKAKFSPAYGDRTMDDSVKAGSNTKTYDEVAAHLKAGDTVVLQGFSLGALAADKLARKLSQHGVDTTNLKVDLIADGYTPGTGALVVLRPYAPLLQPFGITPDGPATHVGGQWTYHCIDNDPTCDMVDPGRDPVGAIVRLAGYPLYHNGQDSVYNYRNLDHLQSTTTYVGGKKVIRYSAPNPIQRYLSRNTTAVAPAAAPVPATVPAPRASAPQQQYVAPSQVQQPVQQAWQRHKAAVPQQYHKPIQQIAGQFGLRLP